VAQGPLKKFRAGALCLSLWENEVEGKNGTFLKKTVSIEKNYKVGEVWKQSKSFSVDEVLKYFPMLIIELAKYCYLKEEVQEDFEV